MKTPLNRMAVLMAIYTERYVLSLVFLWLAAAEFKKTWGLWTGRFPVETKVFIDVVHHLILLLLGVFTSLLLLLGRRAVVPPDKLKLMFVPLATTFYSLLYYTVPWFPKPWQTNLCPADWQTVFVVTGLICIIIGPIFALWGISYLGRSFGVFVAVRRVVLTGPYQWVRHPMYLGWICTFFGVALANFSGAYFLLVTLHISLMLYRARLEETQLSEHSPEYREYMKRTGFIFPKIRLLVSDFLNAE